MNKMKATKVIDPKPSRFFSSAKFATLLLAAGALLIGSKSASAVTVVVDQSQVWSGFMAWSPVSSDAAGYGGSANSPWTPALLGAVFGTSKLTITPNTNTYNVTNTYWVNADGTGANDMTADMYVETTGLYVSTSVTFNFTVTADTLASPYTCVGIIKDFGNSIANTPVVYSTAITGPGTYSVTIPTTGSDPGEIVQYGFETVGPDANPATAASLGSVVLSTITSVTATTNVYVDPSKLTFGYMNWSPVATDAAGYGGTGNSSWGLPALQATFGGANGNVVTLSPNDNVYAAGVNYWVNADGSGANVMDANLYYDGTNLSGLTVTFSGYNWAHTLSASTNYSCVAFIKDFTPTYSSFTEVTSNMLANNLPANGFFSITMPTTPGDNIQYGFETKGPDANPATVASLGSVVVASNPPPAGPIISSVTAAPPIVIVGSNDLLTATATAGGHTMSYQWRKNGVTIPGAPNSASYNLTSVPVTAEASYSVLVTDNTTLQSSTGAVYLAVEQPSHLVVDPFAPYIGYLNFFTINGDGTEGSPEGTRGTTYAPSGLRAGFNNGEAVLMPNTNQWNPSDLNSISGGQSVVFLEGDFYVQDDNLGGDTLTFTGYFPSNSLAGTCYAQVFVEDLASADYSLVTSATTNVVAGQSFTITTTTTAGDHIQYGVRIDGPIESPDNTPDPYGGSEATTAEVSIPLPGLAANRTGNVVSLTFPSENGHSYTIQWTSNLKGGTWTSLGSPSLGNTLPITVTDTAAPSTQRFYRVLAQ